jgi:hypothetical protein
VGHFKQHVAATTWLRCFEEGAIVCHPYIVGEVACGTHFNKKKKKK